MSAATNLISNEIGRGDAKKAKQYIKIGYFIISIHIVILWLITYFIRYKIASIFTDNEIVR